MIVTAPIFFPSDGLLSLKRSGLSLHGYEFPTPSQNISKKVTDSCGVLDSGARFPQPSSAESWT